MLDCLYVASTNAGKLRDFRVAAETHALAVEPVPGLKSVAAPEENGATFAENAALKAVYYSRLAPGQLVMADDSGLEVDALNGAPGVRSARFASDEDFSGSGGSVDERNNELLLERMTAIPGDRRQARYRCVLAVARDGQVLCSAEGAVEGEILTARRGAGGFGYDPLFWLPNLQQSMAETSLKIKHTLSHRGRAFRALLPEVMKML
jgi:XTP/dITP diphosphohydrolase